MRPIQRKRADRGKIYTRLVGSQFTIIEDVPEHRLAIRIRKPPRLDRDEVLNALKFDESWVEIIS
ncbi:MAG: hypothetical protein JW884_13700 [Deltaproteobacteria bacterium]|nr:hypothetical protein [Deltaproteobacteria bacterium]